MINTQIKNYIKKSAISTKNEICGFILSNQELFPCVNVSLNPEYHFLISPIDYLKAAQKDKIEIVYHSHHESTEFSELDKVNLSCQKLRGIVYSKMKDSFNYFLPEEYNNLYINRPFEIGVLDCLSIVTDYYKNELNINIPFIDRTSNWYKSNPNLINKSAEVYCNKIELKDVQKNDILVFDMLENGQPCHLGIYLDNNVMLHHPRFRLSCVEFLSDEWKKKIAYVLRWK